MPDPRTKAAPRLWMTTAVSLLLVVGAVLISLCHPWEREAAPVGSIAAEASQEQEHQASAPGPEAVDGHCGETGKNVADQRGGSLLGTVLLSCGVLGFLRLPLPSRTPSSTMRTHWWRTLLPLGGVRALVSLCIRRV
ncbi:hypothetical protein MRI28_17420 [Nocardiopsis dassonvillei]|uniref:hypothetical protein n=1 Tax=Nocardiopsis dassonvillei TaxID=2014 RepID=UPI00200E2765|nr:hypothetical protein [Nocardiopsis dassonvillei]MCK9871396.1 hypothetical protein [Nocardiopsis dassonvillei]